MEQMKRGFKRKTIIDNIETKLDDWIQTFPDKDFQKELRENVILTGGAITSMLLGDLPNDYDLYFKNPVTASKVAQHYISDLRKTVDNYRIPVIDVKVVGDQVKIMVKSAGVVSDTTDVDDYEYFEARPLENLKKYLKKMDSKQRVAKKYHPVMITSNAITLSDGIQIILRFTGDPTEIHKNYDFVHCTNWFTFEDGLHLNQEALESTLARDLKYIGSLYPIATLFRIRKFIRRGWSITAGEILKISWDISDLDLNDISVLSDQLVGVDAAYFSEVIDLLSREIESGKDIDRTYLFEIINRVFDEATDDGVTVDIVDDTAVVGDFEFDLDQE